MAFPPGRGFFPVPADTRRLGDVYAVSLSSGQSFTLGNNAGGNQAITYTAGAAGLTVILTDQQYYAQVPSRGSAYATGVQGTNFVLGYSDISQAGGEVLDIPIPTTAGVFVVGSFRYLGYSAAATAISSFTLQDAGTGRVLDLVDLAAGANEDQFLESGILISSTGLTVVSPTGTFSGVVRVGRR